MANPTPHTTALPAGPGEADARSVVALRPGAATPAIEVSGLRKIYRLGRGKPGKEALRGIDLSIPPGSLFGLLGPNGAGKSTLINILAGIVIKTGGSVKILGYDIDKTARNARSAIGVVPQELAIDPFFTPRESLDLQAGFYGVPKAERRTDEILEALHLTEVRDAWSRRLSGGMKRRLMVAKAMVHSPPVLVLDEPTAGVDVELRQHLWKIIRGLNAAGTTILLTTHYLEEAEQLCDTIAIIDDGTVVARDKTRALIQRIDRKEVSIVVAEDLSEAPAPLRALDAALHGPRTLTIGYSRARNEIAGILSAVQAAGLSILDLSTEESDLEDVFLDLTGKKSATREADAGPGSPGASPGDAGPDRRA